jgi:hypothetical protein
MSDKALAKLWERHDANYFRRYPDRFYHIRNAYKDECLGEFWSLGPHEEKRRRIILCRVDAMSRPLPDNMVAKLPILAFSDESIEDNDDVLFPIVRDILADALKKETLK